MVGPKNDWDKFKENTVKRGQELAKHFNAGRTKHHVEFWKSLTTDPNIIAMVTGTTLELQNEIVQNEKPAPFYFDKVKEQKIDLEINKLLNRGVIRRAKHTTGEYISNIFTRDKPDGSIRIILDLAEFNENIVYRHFKMDNLNTAIDLMSQNCFMASIDWKDAYYSVPIAKEFQKYLRFEWQGSLYQYTCYPNGLSSAPRNFTKLAKVIFCELRKKGHLCTNYIDDCLILASNAEKCKQTVRETVLTTEGAGFITHPEKSVLEPSQEIVYLGFVLNSISMSVSPTTEKAEKVKFACENILTKEEVTIREFAKVVGLLVSNLPGVQYGQLFYRQCDNLKTKALKENKGNYEAKFSIPKECKEDISWWARKISTATKNILLGKPSIILESDASKSGWGGCQIRGTSREKTGGNWSPLETEKHINYLELLAAWFVIQCFCKSTTNSHIKILCDNTTAVAYLNKMGGTKQECNSLARKIWLWCYKNNNWITSAHVPGIDNTTADVESRSIHDNMEWQLHPYLFEKICNKWGTPEIDLFASRLNHQVKRYYTWKPDPGAEAVDAFTEDWATNPFYAFPPFNLVGRVLKKIETDKAEGILVVPCWPTQAWFSKFTTMCNNGPYILFNRRAQPTLKHPWRKEAHLPNTRLLAALVSAQPSSQETFQKQPKTSFVHHGENPHTNNTTDTSKNGLNIVVKGKWTQIHLI